MSVMVGCSNQRVSGLSLKARKSISIKFGAFCLAFAVSGCSSSDKSEMKMDVVAVDRTSAAIERLNGICKETLKASIVSPSFKNSKAPAEDTVERIVADIRVGFAGGEKDLFEGVYQLTEGITSAFLIGKQLDEYFSSPAGVKLSQDFKVSTVDTLYNGVCIEALQTITAMRTVSKPIGDMELPAKRIEPSFKLDYKAVENVGQKCEAINRTGVYAKSFKASMARLGLRETQNLGIVFSEAQKAVRSDDPAQVILGVALGKQAHEFLSFNYQFSQFLVEGGQKQLPTEKLATGVASRIFSRCQDNLRQALVLFKVNEAKPAPEVAIQKPVPAEEKPLAESVPAQPVKKL